MLNKTQSFSSEALSRWLTSDVVYPDISTHLTGMQKSHNLCFKDGENEAQRSHKDRWYTVGRAPLTSENQSLLKPEVFQMCVLKQVKI